MSARAATFLVALAVPLGAPDGEPQRRPEPPHHVGRQALGCGVLEEPLD
jgi:hypothetical protein